MQGERDMTLTQIRYFVAVADCLNFTKAAEQMYVTQQVISKQIKHLEEEVGFALFQRDKRNVALTEGGALLYEYWAEALDRYNSVMRRAYAAMNKKEQIVRIGTIDVSRIYDWIANAVASASLKNPSWQFRVGSGSYRHLFQGLVDERYDCIISLEDENRDLPEGYEETVFCHFYPKLVIAENHPAYHKGLTLAELEGHTLYAFSAKFSRNALKNIREHCLEVGFEPRSIEEFDGISSLEMALHAGKGYAMTYEPFFRNPVGKLHFIDIDEEISETASGFSIAYAKSKKRMLSQFIASFQGLFQ